MLPPNISDISVKLYQSISQEMRPEFSTKNISRIFLLLFMAIYRDITKFDLFSNILSGDREHDCGFDMSAVLDRARLDYRRCAHYFFCFFISGLHTLVAERMFNEVQCPRRIV